MYKCTISEKLEKTIKNYPQLTISSTKNYLTEIDNNLVMLMVSKEIGDISISDFVTIDNTRTHSRKTSIENDYSYFKGLSFAQQSAFARLFSIGGISYLQFILPLLLQIKVIKINRTDPENSFAEFDDTFGIITFRDVNLNLLPYLRDENYETAGYSAFSSVHDDGELIAIDMRCNNYLQNFMKSPLGKEKIKILNIQNQQIKLTSIGIIIKILVKILDEEHTFNDLMKFNLNIYDFENIISVHQFHSFKNFDYDFIYDLFDQTKYNLF